MPGPATVQGGEDEQLARQDQPLESLAKCCIHCEVSHEELELLLKLNELDENDSLLDEDELELEEEEVRDISICTELTRFDSPLIQRNQTCISLSSAAVLVVAKLYENSPHPAGDKGGAKTCSLPICTAPS